MAKQAKGPSALATGKSAARCFSAHDMPTYAAALAFRGLLSLFPFVLFLTTLLGFLGLSNFFGWLRDQAAQMLPGEAMGMVDTVLDELQRPQGGLMSIGIVLALWSASAAIMAVMKAMNQAFQVRERRATGKRIAVAFGYTIALAVLLAAAAGLMILGPRALSWLAGFVDLSDTFIRAWNWVRWPLVVLLLMLVVSLVYYAAPNIKQPFRFLSAGAVVAVLIWIVASLAFGYYVQNFGSYNKTYGSLGAVIVLLVYFFISAAVLLYGAEINAVRLRARGERIEENPG